MNVATPQEQFASRKRLASLPWKQPEARPAVKPAVNPDAKPDPQSWLAQRMPWPCHAEDLVRVEMVKNEYIERQTARRIIIAVANEYGLKEGDICSTRRMENLVIPRHIAMYLAKAITKRSFPEVGRRFGGRDHTTVLHACRKIEKMMAESESFAAEVNALRAKLEGAE